MEEITTRVYKNKNHTEGMQEVAKKMEQAKKNKKRREKNHWRKSNPKETKILRTKLPK